VFVLRFLPRLFALVFVVYVYVYAYSLALDMLMKHAGTLCLARAFCKMQLDLTSLPGSIASAPVLMRKDDLANASYCIKF
jgi:hypothetical protein